MGEPKKSDLNDPWAQAAYALCVEDHLPPLPVLQLEDGLHVPDVELEALCDTIFRNLAAAGTDALSCG